MKHTVIEENKVKTYEIGDTDMLSENILVPSVSDYVSTLKKSYGKSKVYERILYKLWSKILEIWHNIKIS